MDTWHYLKGQQNSGKISCNTLIQQIKELNSPLYKNEAHLRHTVTPSLWLLSMVFFETPSSFLLSPKLMKEHFTLAFDSLLSFSLRRAWAFSSSFLPFHAEHLGYWKGVLEGSAVIQCEGSWHREERTCNESKTSRYEETEKNKERERKWKRLKRPKHRKKWRKGERKKWR